MNVMVRGTLLGAATVAFGGGCRTWRAVPLIPGEARPLPATARAVRPTGERVELAGGRVTPDSVMFVEERRLSWGRSLGAIGGVYLAAGFLLGVLVAASGF